MNSKLIKLLFGLIGLSALLFAGFFALGEFTPKVEISAHVQISSPLTEVFTVFNDPLDRMDWQEGFEGTERVSGKPGVPGSVCTIFLSHNGEKFEMREELHAFVQDQLVEVTLSNDMFTQQMKVEFAAVSEATTEVSMTGSVEGNSWFVRSMMAIAKTKVQEQEERNFLRLKAYLEQ